MMHIHPMMSWAALVLVALFALFALGVLVAIVVLLGSRKTRAAGIVLLLLVGMCGLGLVGAALVAYKTTQRNLRQTGRPTAFQRVPTAAEIEGLAGPADAVGSRQPVASEARPKEIERDDTTTQSKAAEPPAAAERPDWIRAEPRRVGDTYRMSIDVGPYTTRLECDAHLPEALQEALDEYVELCLGTEAAGKVRLTPDELRKALIKEQWEETRQYETVGPMRHLHVLLAFDPKFKDHVQQQWRREVVAGRLWGAGGAVAATLSVLLVAFGYLKITGRSIQEAKG